MQAIYKVQQDISVLFRYLYTTKSAYVIDLFVLSEDELDKKKPEPLPWLMNHVSIF